MDAVMLAEPALHDGDATAIAYRSWNVIRNAGDAVTPHLIELIAGAAPVYAKAGQTHVLGVGSILFMAGPDSLVWGSGTLGPHVPLPPLRGDQIFALRGRITADDLTKRGVKLNDIPFGDPGIFADEILRHNLFGNETPKRRIAVVPHHASLNHPFFRSLVGSSEVCLVNICDDSMLPLQQIADCEVVISQSLHGLIFAESFGKPAVWIGDPDDWSFAYKFTDWHSTVQNPQPRPAPLGTALVTLLKAAQRQHSNIDRQALRAAFPGAAASIQADPALIGFRACRENNPFTFFLDAPGIACNRAAFLQRALAATDGLFSRFSERPYGLAVEQSAGTLPAPRQTALIAAAMDTMFRTDYAVLAPRAALAALGPATLELGHGVARFERAPAEISALLLRPLYERAPATFAVFGV